MKKLSLTKATVCILDAASTGHARIAGGNIIIDTLVHVLTHFCGSNDTCMTLNGCNKTLIWCVPAVDATSD